MGYRAFWGFAVGAFALGLVCFASGVASMAAGADASGAQVMLLSGPWCGLGVLAVMIGAALRPPDEGRGPPSGRAPEQQTGGSA